MVDDQRQRDHGRRGNRRWTLTPKYKDGTQTVKVKPRVPIVTFAPGRQSRSQGVP